MKKFISLLLVVLLLFSLAACGETTNQSTKDSATSVNMKVAMITDYADINDQSFNQATYEGCKAFCDEAGCLLKYYKPSTNSDEDRIAMIDSAIEDGFNVIVCPGYGFVPALKKTVSTYPDIKFIALDVGTDALGEDYKIPDNLYCAIYQQELSGYMAGYAAVRLGYKKFGFLGGLAVPGVVSYGYGYIQGIDAAAKEYDIDDISVKFAYANQFFGDSDITDVMNTWYDDGTEVVFACGSTIYTSVCESAATVKGKVIGVDVDQKQVIDGQYGEGMTLTSAMKGLAASVKSELNNIKDGKFQGGIIESLGIISEEPDKNYVLIPMESTQFGDGFTQDDYKALVADIYNGKIKVDNSIDAKVTSLVSKINVEDLGNIK